MADYHHGDLPAALRRATVELIAERGATRFSLREVARRAGVSHAAPAHHFGHTQGLLAAVAAEGFGLLTDAIRAAIASAGEDPRDQLLASGRAYVRTALANPGHYRVMIYEEMPDPDDDLIKASTAAYQTLLDVVVGLRDHYAPELDVDSTATILWAQVHGLVELVTCLEPVAAATGTTRHSVDDLLVRFTDLIMSGIEI